MLDNAIKELEAVRDRLMDQAVGLDQMIDNLRKMENGTSVTVSVGEVAISALDARREKNRSQERERKILELLDNNNPLTNKQIARSVGCGVSTATASTHALVREGKIAVVGKRGVAYLYALASESGPSAY